MDPPEIVAPEDPAGRRSDELDFDEVGPEGGAPADPPNTVAADCGPDMMEVCGGVTRTGPLPAEIVAEDCGADNVEVRGLDPDTPPADTVAFAGPELGALADPPNTVAAAFGLA